MQNNNVYSGGEGGYSYSGNSNSYQPNRNNYQSSRFDNNQKSFQDYPEKGYNSFDNQRRDDRQSNTSANVNRFDFDNNEWSSRGGPQSSAGTEKSFNNRNQRSSRFEEELSNTVSSYPERTFHNYSGPSSTQSNTDMRKSRFDNDPREQYSSRPPSNADLEMNRFGNNQRNQGPSQFHGHSELNSYGNERSKTNPEISRFDNSQMNQGPRGFQGSTDSEQNRFGNRFQDNNPQSNHFVRNEKSFQHYSGSNRFESIQRNADPVRNRFDNNKGSRRPIPNSSGYEGLNFDNQSNRGPSTSQRNYSGLERNRFENMERPDQRYSYQFMNRSESYGKPHIKKMKVEPELYNSRATVTSRMNPYMSKIKTDPELDYSQDSKILTMTGSEKHISKLKVESDDDITEDEEEEDGYLEDVSQERIFSDEPRPVNTNNSQDDVVMSNHNTEYFRNYKIGELLDLHRGRLVQLTGKYIHKYWWYGGFQDDTGYVQIYVNKKKKELQETFESLEDNSQMIIRGKLTGRDRRRWDNDTSERNGRIEIEIMEIPTKEELLKEAAQINDLLIQSVIPKFNNQTRNILFTEASKRGPGNITFLRAFKTREISLQDINRVRRDQGISPEELAMANRNYQAIEANKELNSFIDRQLKIREILGIAPPKITEDDIKEKNYLKDVSKDKILSEEPRRVNLNLQPWFDDVIIRDDDEDIVMRNTIKKKTYFREYKIGELFNLPMRRVVQITGKFSFIINRPGYGGLQDDTGYVQIIAAKKGNRKLFEVFNGLKNNSENIIIRGKIINRNINQRDDTLNGRIVVKIMQIPTKIELRTEDAQVEALLKLKLAQLNLRLTRKLTKQQKLLLLTAAAKRGPGNITFLSAFKTREMSSQKVQRLQRDKSIPPEELAKAKNDYQAIVTNQELNGFIDRQLKIRKLLRIAPPKITEDNFEQPSAEKR